jgi:hypothetical protein
MRRLSALALLAVSTAVAGVTGLWLLSNGPTLAALALASLSGALLSFAGALWGSRPTRALVGGSVLLFFSAGWAVSRWARPASQAVELCVNSDCDRPRVSLGRLVPELESMRAGLLLSRGLGITSADELASYRQVVATAYGALSDDFRAAGNPAFELSLPGRVVYARVGPKSPMRCVVFLHGFGGLLTAYVEAISNSPLGKDAVVLAPVLDPVGRWDSARGAEVVRALVDSQPGGCWLVGLSNGAVGGWRLPARAELRGKLRGAVLLSGLGAPEPGLPAVPTLVISGKHDLRFPFDWVRDVAAAAGVAAHGLEADHFLILSAKDEWTRLAAEWIEAQPPAP